MNNFALVFPGQGSQSIGMLSDLSDSYPLVKQTFEEASEVLSMNLWQLVMDGPAEDLNQTQNTQPAMLAAGIAVYRVWTSQLETKATIMAGHSLGEYSALVAAGSLSFTDAISLVSSRGQFMQEAVAKGEGAMAAVLGLDDESVIKLCADNAKGDVLEAVNFNSPGQVVVAGSANAIERLVASAKEAGAKRALPLPVSVPSHCALMKPAAERLKAAVADVKMSVASVPVLHNVNVSNSSNTDDIKTCLTEQLYKPVRWVETIESIRDNYETNTLIECGPGKVLAGLNKRIDKQMSAAAIIDSATLQKALELVNE